MDLDILLEIPVICQLSLAYTSPSFDDQFDTGWTWDNIRFYILYFTFIL